MASFRVESMGSSLRTRHNERAGLFIKEEGFRRRTRRILERLVNRSPFVPPLLHMTRTPRLLPATALERFRQPLQHTRNPAQGFPRALRLVPGTRSIHTHLDSLESTGCFLASAMNGRLPTGAQRIRQRPTARQTRHGVQMHTHIPMRAPRLHGLEGNRYAARTDGFMVGRRTEVTRDHLSQNGIRLGGPAEGTQLLGLQIASELQQRHDRWAALEKLIHSRILRVNQHLRQFIPLGNAIGGVALENAQRGNRNGMLALNRITSEAMDVSLAKGVPAGLHVFDLGMNLLAECRLKSEFPVGIRLGLQVKHKVNFVRTGRHHAKTAQVEISDKGP